MNRSFVRGVTAAVFAAGSALWLSPAFAHAVCGDRIFPATLAIDDPGVGDEVVLPNLNVQSPTGVGQESLTFSWAKTITENFGVSIQSGFVSQQGSQGGIQPITTEEKLKLFCWAEHEFMASAGFQQTWGFTGTPGVSQNLFNTYTPIIDVGKGFGDLPKSLNLLRPLAITAAISENYVTDPTQAPNMFNLGFTLQYSLPYYNEHVAEIDNSFLKHLVPVVEANFQWPTANTNPGDYTGLTGTIQPGVIYEADTWQFALEAIVPVNAQSGTNVGFVGELHFFLDDIFPNSLGKPLFGGKS